MKKIMTFLAIFLTFFSGKSSHLFAAQYDYQNYNHGYCPQCERCGCNPCSCPTPSSETVDQLPQPTPPPCSTPCDTPCNKPCAASVQGSQCGISICTLGLVIAALAAAGAIIISSGNGTISHH